MITRIVLHFRIQIIEISNEGLVYKLKLNGIDEGTMNECAMVWQSIEDSEW